MTLKQETAVQLERCARLHVQLAQSKRAVSRECGVQAVELRRTRTRLETVRTRRRSGYGVH